MRAAGVVVMAVVSGLLAGATGCFSPSPAVGLACAPPEGGCPSGQHCASGICVADDDPPDASRGADAAVADAGPDAPPGSIDATVIDGPVDAVVIDAPPPDATPPCPMDYQPLIGGQTGHVYRKIEAATSWPAQRDDCANDGFGTYLAIPNNQTELNALIATGNDLPWVGLTDAANEGNWKTVIGGNAPFLPWGAGQPDDLNGAEDCAEGRGPTAGYNYDLNDDACGGARVAVCECVSP